MKTCNALKLLNTSFVITLILLIGIVNVLLLVFYHVREVQNDTVEAYDTAAFLPSIFPTLKATKLQADSTIDDIAKGMPNLPVYFWKKSQKLGMQYNKTCAKFPNIFFLNYNNKYWQVLQTSGPTFYMFGAYKDARQKNPLGPSVRILAMLDKLESKVKIYCHLWFNETKKPVITPISDYKEIWSSNMNYSGLYLPYLISCKIPPEAFNKSLMAVSVVENSCNTASNLLKVVYNTKRNKEDIAVCTRSLYSPKNDISLRLIEWIELLQILGADKIFFYTLDLHPNVDRVLKYYEHQGLIKTTPITLPGKLPNGPLLQYHYILNNTDKYEKEEVLILNDCFYRNMYEYNYITVLGMDEIIIPMNKVSWNDMIKIMVTKLTKQSITEVASFNAYGVNFLDKLLQDRWFDNIPPYMYMLQHVYPIRNDTVSEISIKSIFNTDTVMTINQHFPVTCFKDCLNYNISFEDAQLRHYTSDGSKKPINAGNKSKNDNIIDTTIWKYKKRLIKNVRVRMKDLNLV